jgi:hypothetical protein
MKLTLATDPAAKLDGRLSVALGVPVCLRLVEVPEGVDFREFADTIGTMSPVRSVSYSLPWAAVLSAARCHSVGVDIESLDRRVDERIARFVRARGESAHDQLTLWTIKEAAYKADPSSRDFTDYLVTPGSCLTPSGKTLRTATITHDGLRISVAVHVKDKESR